jgi:hypothetical protein
MGYPKTLRMLLHLLQLLLLVSLIGATASQTWSSISFEVQATDGAPTGYREGCCMHFGIGAELNISQNSSEVDFSLAGLSAMSYWQNQRVNEVVIPQEEKDNDGEDWGNNSLKLTEVQDGLPQAVKIITAISAVVLFIHLMGYQRRWIPGLILNLALFTLILAFVIMPTVGWFGEFDVESKGTGGGSLDLEHQQIFTDYNLTSESLEFYFNVSGFDLAMANESEQWHISDNLTSADIDHVSFIAFDGSLDLSFTPLIQDLVLIWLVVFTILPLTLIVIERVEIDSPLRLEEK